MIEFLRVMRTPADKKKKKNYDKGNALIVLFSNLNLNIVIEIPNPKAISSTVPYFSLQAAVLVSSKQIEFSDIFRNWTFIKILL